ncbi:MAG TPA: M28 family peptidase [Fulvivirga sp.]|nr:M28 family peptidase [Fulvivirga sp.]
MKKLFLSAFLFIAFISVHAQVDVDAQKFANTITEADLTKHLSVIASDAMQGRETGEVGQKMAAAYIAEQFKMLGLVGPVKGDDNNGFYQKVPLYVSEPGNIYVTTQKGTHKNFDGLVYFGSTETPGEVNKEIVFAGTGSAQDFENLDVKDKAVLILSESTWGWRSAARTAKEKNASILLVVNSSSDADFESLVERYSSSKGRLSLERESSDSNDGLFFLSPSLAEEMLGMKIEELKTGKKKIKPAKISYKIGINVREVPSENVLGYLEGSDLKDELIVITAHYDHLGKKGDDIYNGADDDGSGTVSILEIAQAFVDAKNAGKGPRRSILFMTVTGEEKGLLGSKYYSDHPIFPLENTVANLNIDMIGRVDPKHEDNPNYVYLVGADRISKQLNDISEKTNDTYTKLTIDYTYNDENHPERIYYRSDHWNFAKHNIPVIFYFNGTHADYHQPTDTIEKINFGLLRTRAQLVFYTAWTLVNMDHRLILND